MVVTKKLRFTNFWKTKTTLLTGPSFEFKNLVNLDSISIDAKTIKLHSATIQNASLRGDVSAAGDLIIENVVMESPLRFSGKSIMLTHSLFRKDVEINSDEIQISFNRFDENTNIESSKNGYVNSNIFLGQNRKATFVGKELFVERNCRNPSRDWTAPTGQSNAIDNKCTLSSLCVINPAPDSTLLTKTKLVQIGDFNPSHIKVGDFDGDGKDELVRIEEGAWHHYDFRSEKWSLLRREKNTPPWAIGVADLDDDGKDSLIKADGYLIRVLSEDGSSWKDGAAFEEGFARQYLMTGNIIGDGKSEFIKFDRKTGKIFSSSADKIDWKEETQLKTPFTKIESLDYDGDGFDELIAHQNRAYNVYNFGDKKWKSYRNYGGSTLFGNFDGVGEIDRFVGGKRMISEKVKIKFEKYRRGQIIADTNGDGLDEIFSDCLSQKPTLKIASYNINHAGVRTVEELAEKIKSIDAELIVLQEVDRNTKRNPYDMVSALAKNTGYPFHKFFISNERYQGGEYGLVVLSRSPIEKVEVVQLPDHENLEEWSEQNIAVVFESGKKKYITTHIIPRSWRKGVDLSQAQDRQIAALIKLVNTHQPDFVLGDFNTKPSSQGYRDFLKQTQYKDSFTRSGNKKGVTFPDIHGDPRRIDYIFLKPDFDEFTENEIPAWIHSDHYPYILSY